MKKNIPSSFMAAVFLATMLLAPFIASAQSQLIKDVNRTEDPNFNEYSDFTYAGTTMYFVSLGKEIWKSNGTSAGTVRLKSLTSISNLTAVGNILYFAGTDGGGSELWKTDGVTTVRVKDIRVGPLGSVPKSLVNVNGLLYFTANDGQTGVELWKSDGSAAGTVRVRDIFPGTGSSNPTRLTNVNGTVYFNANDNVNGYELWKSNGTSGGTLLVKNINPGTKASSFPQLLTNLNGVLYFSATDGTTGQELWKSNGTSSGTVRVKDIYPGATGSSIDNMTAVGSVVMFSATNGSTGKELWKSNGTSTGTVLVKDITPGSESSFGWPGGHNFTAINGALYFTTGEYGGGYIMRSDGTSAGTKIITQAIEPGLGNPVITRFTLYNGNIYFFNHQEEYYYPYYGLYRIDLNGNNLALIKTLWIGDPYTYEHDYMSPYATNMLAVGSVLYLSGRLTQQQGTKLLRSDGTAAGTIAVKDTYIKTFGSSPDLLTTASDGKIYFRANGRLGHDEYYEDIGHDLWVTDGTTAGTIELLKSQGIWNIVPVGSKVFFINMPAEEKSELWVSNGTTSGTIKLRDEGAFAMIEANGLLYFSSGAELWKSNGTVSGTVRIHTFASIIDRIHKLGTRLIIKTSWDETLWVSDGTSAGTTMVKSFASYNSSYLEGDLITAKGYVYFIADDGNGDELWRTNGTASGTQLVTDLRTNDINDADFAGIQAFRDSVYFSAMDNTGAWALFKTNGTASSTKKLKNINPVYQYAVKGQEYLLLFPEKQGIAGNDELWVTKGSASSTIKLKDLTGYHLPQIDYVVINDVVYFNVQFFHGGIMSNLWRSDGTACGTFDFSIGAMAPFPMEAMGTSIVFGGGSPRELYRYNTTLAPASPCGTPTSATAVADVEVIDMESGGDIIRSSPNPFRADFTFKVSGDDNQVVKAIVYNSTGAPLETHEDLRCNTEYRLGANWASGLYIIRANLGDKVITQKVIKE